MIGNDNGQPAAPVTAGNADALGNDLARLEAQAVIGSQPAPEIAAASAMQAAEAAQEVDEYAALVEGLAVPLFGIMAPAWNVTPAECKALGQGVAPVLAKYFPGGASNPGPEDTAVVTVAVIFGPRIGTPRKVADDKPKAAAA